LSSCTNETREMKVGHDVLFRFTYDLLKHGLKDNIIYIVYTNILHTVKQLTQI